MAYYRLFPIFHLWLGSQRQSIILFGWIELCAISLKIYLAQAATQRQQCGSATGLAELALPHHQHIPPHLVKQTVVALIALTVATEFCCPKIDISQRHPILVAAFMSMPKAPVYKYHGAIFCEHYIGTAR